MILLRVIILIGLQLLAVSATPQPSGLSYLDDLSKEARNEIFDENNSRMFGKDGEKLSIEEVMESIEITRYLREKFKLNSSPLYHLERLLRPTNCNLFPMMRKSTEIKLFVSDHPNLIDFLLKKLYDDIIQCITEWFGYTNAMGDAIMREFRDHVSDFESAMSRVTANPIRCARPLLPASVTVGISRLAKGQTGNYLLVRGVDPNETSTNFMRRFESELKNLIKIPCQDWMNKWKYVAGPWLEMSKQSDQENNIFDQLSDYKFIEFLDYYQICEAVVGNQEILQTFVDEKYKHLIAELEKFDIEATLTSGQTRVALDMLMGRIDPTKFRRYLEMTSNLSTCRIDNLKILHENLATERNGNLWALLKISSREQFGVCLTNVKVKLVSIMLQDTGVLQKYSHLDSLLESIDRERSGAGRGTSFYDEFTEDDYTEGLKEYWKAPRCFSLSNIKKRAKSKFKNICDYLADREIIDVVVDWIELAKLDVHLAVHELQGNSDKYLKRALVCRWLRTIET